MPTEKIKCKKCGKVNRIGVKYCTECGILLEAEEKSTEQETSSKTQVAKIVCPNCKANIRSNTKFCTNCGFLLRNIDGSSFLSDDYNKAETEKTDFSDETDNKSNQSIEGKTICPSCGNHNSDDLAYCRRCGTRIKETEDELANESGKKSKLGLRLLILIVMLILVLIVAIVVGYLYFSDNKILMNFIGNSSNEQGIESSDVKEKPESKRENVESIETEKKGEKEEEKKEEDAENLDKEEDKEEDKEDKTSDLEITEADIFEGVSLVFSGKNGKGIAELIGERDYKGLSYVISKQDNLYNEDTVEVTIQYEVSVEDFVKKNGIKPVSEKKEFIVTGLEEEDNSDKIEVRVPIVFVDSSSFLNVKSKDNSTYEPANTLDGNVSTAWIEGVDGDGINESITYRFEEEYDVSKVVIYNGFLKSKYRYTINGKPTKIQMVFGNGEVIEEELNVIHPGEEDVEFAEDELNPTVITFEVPIPSDSLSIVIQDVETGTKYEDTAISDVEIYGLTER